MATFDVDVGGVTYEVDAPDERTAWKWANVTHSQPPEKSPLPQRPANLRHPQEPGTFDKLVGKFPTSGFVADSGQRLVDLSAGMSGLMRGGANLVSDGLGEKMFPTTGATDSVTRDIGKFLDPVALAIGGGVGKVLPYVPVLSKAATATAPAIKGGGALAVARNAGSGGISGGAIGGLSDEGDAATGAGIGAGLNTVLPPALSAAGRAGGRLADLVSGRWTDAMASGILRSAAGKDLPAMQAATSAAPSGLTAAQATSGIKNDVWNALDDLSKRGDRESFYSRLTATQKQDVADGLSRAAGGANQTEARQVAGQSKGALNKVTSPMRESALADANTGFLDTSKITSGLQSRLDSPSSAGSRKYESVINRVMTDIDDWAAKNNGKIDAEALYAIRKNSVNDAVEDLTKGLDPKSSAKYAAGVLAEVRPMIDDAIESAAMGVGPRNFKWKDYLKTFEAGSRQIDQQKMGAKALDLFNKQPNTLESLAAGNEPKMVEKVFKSEFDLRKAMSPKQVRAIDDAAAYLSREREILEGAARGRGGLDAILEENIAKFKLPNWINAKIAVTNRALSEIEKRVNKSTMDKIQAAMKSGASANAMLSVITPSQRSVVLAAILRGHGAIGGGIVSGSQNEPVEQPRNLRPSNSAYNASSGVRG